MHSMCSLSWLNITILSYQDRIYHYGVTKTPFINYSVSKIFDLTKVTVRFVESHSYLVGVPIAELRWHLSNINVIFNNSYVFRQCWKFKKKMKWRKLCIVTHTPASMQGARVSVAMLLIQFVWNILFSESEGINPYLYILHRTIVENSYFTLFSVI